jgi:hypothetical protein
LITVGKKMDLSRYSNPMASIHTTLRRMVDSGEVGISENASGEKGYRLNTPAQRISNLRAKALIDEQVAKKK